jgi:hypothetical protein
LELGVLAGPCLVPSPPNQNTFLVVELGAGWSAGWAATGGCGGECGGGHWEDSRRNCSAHRFDLPTVNDPCRLGLPCEAASGPGAVSAANGLLFGDLRAFLSLAGGCWGAVYTAARGSAGGASARDVLRAAVVLDPNTGRDVPASTGWYCGCCVQAVMRETGWRHTMSGRLRPEGTIHRGRKRTGCGHLAAENR